MVLVRLLVGLLYLKHTYNESDESVCERWTHTNVKANGCVAARAAMRMRSSSGDCGVYSNVSDHSQGSDRGVCEAVSAFQAAGKSQTL